MGDPSQSHERSYVDYFHTVKLDDLLSAVVRDWDLSVGPALTFGHLYVDTSEKVATYLAHTIVAAPALKRHVTSYRLPVLHEWDTQVLAELERATAMPPLSQALGDWFRAASPASV